MIRRYKYLLLAMLIAFVSHVIASDKALVNVYKKAQQPKQQFGYHQTTNKTPWESIIKAYEQADLATPPEKDAPISSQPKRHFFIRGKEVSLFLLLSPFFFFFFGNLDVNNPRQLDKCLRN